MKCIILCFILICSIFTSFAQKIQDFENGFFSEWGTNGNVEEYPNSKFEIVENICKKGLNSTEKCAKMSRYGSGKWTYGWFYFKPITMSSAIIDNPLYVHIMTFHEKKSEYGESNNPIIKYGEWQDFVYKLANSGTFSKMEFTPTTGNDDIDVNIYIDEIIIDGNPEPRRAPSDLIENEMVDWNLYIDKNGIKIFNGEGNIQVEIFSLDGKCIYMENVDESEININTSFILEGVYIIRITDWHRSYIKKIIL